MSQLTLELVNAACSPGGASVLTVVTELAPAAGEHAGVSPARYVSGNKAVYAFETRYVGGEAVKVVILDGKASSLNRVEGALAEAILDEDPALAITPRIEVSYPNTTAACYELPHRAFDGHVRAGTVDGQPVTSHPAYIAVRNSTAADARPLVEMSPVSAAFGAWDSTRASHQVRFRSALVGEVIGVLADQGPDGTDIQPRGSARVDSVAPSVRLAGAALESLVQAQEGELSTKNVAKIRREIKGAGSGTISAAGLGLGSIPPSLVGLGLVACRRIIRSQVLSFSALRQLRFGAGREGDVTCRALLAAFALYSLRLANDELLLRANCDLVERFAPKYTLDGRDGAIVELNAPSREVAQQLLLDAIAQAKATAGLIWDGQVFAVQGNPLIAGGIEAEVEDE